MPEPSFTPLVDADRVIVVTEDNRILFVDLNGQLLVQIPTSAFPLDAVVMSDRTVVARLLDESLLFLDGAGQTKAKISPTNYNLAPLACRGDTILVPIDGFGVGIMNSSGILLNTALIQAQGFSTPTRTSSGAYIYATRDKHIITILPDNTMKNLNAPQSLGGTEPVVYADQRFSVTTWAETILFYDSTGQLVGKFSAQDDKSISAAVEVEPGVAAMVGVNNIYYIDIKTAKVIDTVALPAVPTTADFEPSAYRPLVLKDGTLVFSHVTGLGSSKIYLLKRGQQIE